ncbi:MAG: hypothetical protein AAF551_05325 [Bacteroidota bacterium]
MMRYLLSFVFFYGSILLIQAQIDSKVLVRNHPDNTVTSTTIESKWFSLQLTYEEGVNVYRKQNGTDIWEKLNESPIQMKDTLPPARLAEDPDLELFAEALKNLGPNPTEGLTGLFLVNILGKLFQSTPLADHAGIYYRDETAVAGSTYTYRISRLVNGKEQVLGTSSEITAGPYQPVPQVTDFTAIQEKKTILLDWTVKSEDYFSYNLYYQIKDSIQEVRLNEQPIVPSQAIDSMGNYFYPTPKFKFQEALEGKEYIFWIKGLDFFGDESAVSDSITVSFRDITPPLPPSELTTEVDAMNVTLDWIPSASPDASAQIVYRRYGSEGEWLPVVTLEAQEDNYLDLIEVPGTYFYYIAVMDSSKNEAQTSYVVADVEDLIPPVPPSGLTILSDTGKLVLSWKANAEPDLLGYQIFRTVNGNKRNHYILLNSEPIKSTRFVQELPKVVKNKFFYYVIAMDTSYNRSEPSDYATGQMPDVLPPEQPFIKKTTYESGNIVISWTQNVENDLMGYDLYRSDSTSVLNYQKINPRLIGRDAFRFVDRSSQPNQGYLYHLTALDSAGNASYPSLPAYAYRWVEENSASSQLKATIKYNKQKGATILRWQPPEGSEVLGYVVFKAEEDEPMKPLTGMLKTLSTRDKTSEGVATTYQVKAYTTSGKMILSEKLVLEIKAKKHD